MQRNTNRIVTIERGRIVEDGTHDQLIKRGGRYASLFDKEDLGHDVIAPGAFRDSLADRGATGVKMLFQHNPSEPPSASGIS